MTVRQQHPRLEGDFVQLRPLVLDDAAMTFSWRQSQRAALLNQGASDVEQQRAWIARRPADEFNFIIETRAQLPIGMLSLTSIDRTTGTGEPGRFLIGNEDAARGLPAAAEAMQLLYRLAFDDLRLRRLWGMVASANVRMIKWQKYMGMTEEGRLRQHLWIDNRFQDAVLFGLLEPEYRITAAPRLEAFVRAGRQAIAPTNDRST